MGGVYLTESLSSSFSSLELLILPLNPSHSIIETEENLEEDPRNMGNVKPGAPGAEVWENQRMGVEREDAQEEKAGAEEEEEEREEEDSNEAISLCINSNSKTSRSHLAGKFCHCQ